MRVARRAKSKLPRHENQKLPATIARCPNVPLFPVNRAARRKILKIVRQRPVQFGFDWTRNQADVFRNFEPPDKRPCVCASIPIFGAPTVSVIAASIAAPKCSPVSAFRPDGTSTASTGIFDALIGRDEFLPAIVQRAVQADAEQTVNDESGTGILPVRDRLEACPT